MAEVPFRMYISGVKATVPDLRRAPDAAEKLASFLEALAAELRGEVNSDGKNEGQGEDQQAGDQATSSG